jgi:hypothetical protein
MEDCIEFCPHCGNALGETFWRGDGLMFCDEACYRADMAKVRVDENNLNGIMDFDRVIQVHEDGTVTHRPDLYSPDLTDYELTPADKWTLLNGYSGQDRYSGPVMHNSEQLAGGIARDILAEPGVYVAIVAYWSPDEDDNEETTLEGWAVAKLKD